MIYPIAGFSVEMQPPDVLLRLCVYAEARGERPEGQLAVAWVAGKNRPKRFGWSVKETILKNNGTVWQFSAFSPKDANYPKMLTAHQTNPAAWSSVDAVCSLFELKLTIDPTDGADHYYNPTVADPYWGRRHPDWKEHVVLGHHVFGIAA